MIESLLIRGVALFEEALLTFGEGLHVLTGETGAGKSLVVDAMNFLCGARTDREFLRAGSDKAYVEGVFQVNDLPRLQEALLEQSLETEDGFLTLSRELNAAGRSVCRIGGVAVSLSAYRTLTAQLIDLHGQHEHQSLLQENRHLSFLDSFGGDGHLALVGKVGVLYAEYSKAKEAFESALGRKDAVAERMEILALRLGELQGAKLVPGEEEALQQEKNLLKNAERIRAALQGASGCLSDSPRGEPDALANLINAEKHLDTIKGLDTRFAGVSDRATALRYELEELGHDLNVLMRDVNPDAPRLEAVETRLDLLRKMSRKYGATVGEMLQTLSDTQAEIAQLESLDEQLEALESDTERALQAYLGEARRLSSERRGLAETFERRLESLLAELNMAGTRFRVLLTSDESHVRADGIDQAAMLIAPNVGEDYKPLARIASGGELSRLMLAIKSLSAQKNEIPTMVFDEIDTGVSGKTATVIARKLWEIARYRQVVCVTHLHQLAAMANRHYHVSKSEQDGRTTAGVRLMETEERQREIAIMLGDPSTQEQSSLLHADVLLRDAEQYRQNHPVVSRETFSEPTR